MEREKYKQWFNESFSLDELEVLRSIGVVCEADHRFFKLEILTIFGYLTNQKLKNYPHLYQKIIDRYIDINPPFIRAQIDRNLIENDKYYAAWFFNRVVFFENYKQGKERLKNTRLKLLWEPLLDNHTPLNCYDFKNKIFDFGEVFLEQAIIHWEKPNKGCRCSLRVVRESVIENKIELKQYQIWNT